MWLFSAEFLEFCLLVPITLRGCPHLLHPRWIHSQKGKEKAGFPFKGMTQKLPSSLLLTQSWPELSHMAILNFKGDWKFASLYLMAMSPAPSFIICTREAKEKVYQEDIYYQSLPWINSHGVNTKIAFLPKAGRLWY